MTQNNAQTLQRGGLEACFPSRYVIQGVNPVSPMLIGLLFLVFVMILIDLVRPVPLATRDLRVWTDETERRMLQNLPPRDRR